MFPEDRAKAVVLRMIRMGTIGDQVMADLKATLQEDFLAGFRKRQTTGQPDVLITGLLNEMSQSRAGAILQSLQEHDWDLAVKVQKKLFTFPDFCTRIGSAGLQTVIRNCERDTLILALTLAKRNAPDVMEYFFDNMSKRVAEQMREEMQDAGAIRVKHAEAAQQELVRLAQALAKSGEIDIIENDEEDRQVLE
jgi:flagellar motor switch protein FliG